MSLVLSQAWTFVPIAGSVKGLADWNNCRKCALLLTFSLSIRSSRGKPHEGNLFDFFFYHRVILEIKKKKLNLSNAMKSLLYTFNVYFFQVAVSFSKVYCYRKMSCVTKLKKNSYIDILVDVEWNYISHVSLPFWRLYPWVLLVLKFFRMTV